MRKFVIKNRHKRKYTKKSEEAISSLSKTMYGMVPVMIMTIAFMATMIISIPFRDTFSHIRFSLQPPEFSLSNPLTFFQVIIQDMRQISLVVLSTLVLLFTKSIEVFVSSGKTTAHAATFLNPLPLLLLLGDGLTLIKIIIESFFIVLWHGILASYNAFILCSLFIESILQGLITAFVTFIFTGIVSLAKLGTSGVIMLWEAISTVFIFVFQQLLSAATIVVQTIITLFTFLGHSLTVFIETLLGWIIVTAETIFSAIGNFLNAVMHIIEIPFKRVYAFWLQIKPYVDIFDHHVKLAGKDFTNGVNSLVKVTMIISSSK